MQVLSTDFQDNSMNNAVTWWMGDGNSQIKFYRYVNNAIFIVADVYIICLACQLFHGCMSL